MEPGRDVKPGDVLSSSLMLSNIILELSSYLYYLVKEKRLFLKVGVKEKVLFMGY